MTNNKQQTTMKLYTEDDLRDFIDRNGCIVESDLDEKQLTPIELPSDEEIKQEANKEYQEQQQSYENSVEMFPINFANYLEVGFIDGMKSMRNKIQGGNK